MHPTASGSARHPRPPARVARSWLCLGRARFPLFWLGARSSWRAHAADTERRVALRRGPFARATPRPCEAGSATSKGAGGTCKNSGGRRRGKRAVGAGRTGFAIRSGRGEWSLGEPTEGARCAPSPNASPGQRGGVHFCRAQPLEWACCLPVAGGPLDPAPCRSVTLARYPGAGVERLVVTSGEVRLPARPLGACSAARNVSWAGGPPLRLVGAAATPPASFPAALTDNCGCSRG